MIEPIPIERWPTLIQPHVSAASTIFQRVHIIRETNSTQDAARLINAQAGDVVVAWHQSAGRGRLGRKWADTGEHGVAITMAVHCKPPEVLAIASAIGTAFAIETVLEEQVEIKWPNDVLVKGRKLAGVLIEQVDRVALVGVGINVAQQTFPGEISGRAVSLHQLGARVDRVDVIMELLTGFERALKLADSELVGEFAKRDVLTGSVASFRMNGQVHAGRVVRLDPMRGLVVDTGEGEIWLAAAQTTVCSELPATVQPTD